MVHGFNHVIDQVEDAGIHLIDSYRTLPKALIGIDDDIKRAMV
jgi:hypothetical protein